MRTFFTPHTSLLRQLNWQSFLQRVDYQFCLFMFKVINGLVPEYLKDLIIFRTPQIPTRFALNSPLYIPKPKTEYMKSLFNTMALAYGTNFHFVLETPHHCNRLNLNAKFSPPLIALLLNLHFRICSYILYS